MATISVILKTHRKKQDGTFPICIRVTEKNKTRYKYVGYSVTELQFKEGLNGWVRKHPDSVLINTIIESERTKIQEKLTRLVLEKRNLILNICFRISQQGGIQ
ncbi:Arm DNA-binding domain-containing protein [Chitinophaga sp.]|uniref:Arm DNA-binding domain-containing protein n=1 Tax=Chitinophaga sp. TaxID=1869181 RepID=UPI0039C88355